MFTQQGDVQPLRAHSDSADSAWVRASFFAEKNTRYAVIVAIVNHSSDNGISVSRWRVR